MKNTFELFKTSLKRIEEEKGGQDFQIMTHLVWDEDSRIIPYGRFFKKDISVAIGNKSQKEVREMIKEQEVNSETNILIESTRPIKMLSQDLFLLDEKMIDFDVAVDCNLGIIRIDDNYYLYNSEDMKQGELSLMIDVYLQIVVPSYNNETLEKYFNKKEGYEHIKSLKGADDDVIFQKLKKSFEKNNNFIN